MRALAAALLAGSALQVGAADPEKLWVPEHTDEETHANVHGAFRGHDMRCINNERSLRGCLMKDLYYDRKKKEFLFFGRSMGDDDDAATASDAELEQQFKEKMSYLDFAKKTSDIKIRWSAAPPPTAAQACRVSVPIHLRQEYRVGTGSLGHMLRDNYQALVTLPMQFGLTAAAFSWASWPRTRGLRPNDLSHVQEKYNSWISMHAPYKWKGLEEACTRGALGAGLDEPSPRKNVRYVHIEQALASGAGYFWASGRAMKDSGMRACERAHWQAQRDHAYRLNAVPHVPVADQARTLISILYKPKRDKRRAIFSASVLAAVRARWPDADVEVHDGMSETADAQLAWLSRTSVLITNVGSAGFRLLYLPDGAQVVMVGPYEGEIKGADGKMHGSPFQLFMETTQCWQYLPHVTMHKYHVTDIKDIDLPKGKQLKGSVGKQLRNAHVHVRTEKLLPVLDEALARVDDQRDVFSSE